MKLNKVGKAIAVGAIGVGLIAGGALAGANLFPQQVPVIKEVTKFVPVEKPIVTERIVEIEKEVEKIVEVPVEVEVEVEDLSFKQLACDKLLYDDLDECVEEVKAEDKALKLALEFIDSEFNGDISDELEDKGLIEDEDDVELIKVYDELEDIEVIDSDFDDDEYRFKIKAKIEDTDNEVKKYVILTIDVEDGEAELKKVTEE